MILPRYFIRDSQKFMVNSWNKDWWTVVARICADLLFTLINSTLSLYSFSTIDVYRRRMRRFDNFWGATTVEMSRFRTFLCLVFMCFILFRCSYRFPLHVLHFCVHIAHWCVQDFCSRLQQEVTTTEATFSWSMNCYAGLRIGRQTRGKWEWGTHRRPVILNIHVGGVSTFPFTCKVFL